MHGLLVVLARARQAGAPPECSAYCSSDSQILRCLLAYMAPVCCTCCSAQPTRCWRPHAPTPLPPPRSDSSPIMVELRDVRPGLLRLLVRTCAVVGGAFAVTGLWDKVVHRAVTSVKKHMA